MEYVHLQPEKHWITPTKAALCRHIETTVFISVFIWHGTLAKELRLPALADYGRERNLHTEGWVPHWTHLEDASVACSLLEHCSCNKGSKGRCIWYEGGLRWTPLCKCQEGCCNNQELNRLMASEALFILKFLELCSWAHVSLRYIFGSFRVKYIHFCYISLEIHLWTNGLRRWIFHM